MIAHDGASPRTVRAMLGAALALVLTALVLSAQTTPAQASSTRTVTLGVSNVTVDINAGDSVTFAPIGGLYKIVARVTGTVRYSNPGTYSVTWTWQLLEKLLGPIGKITTCTATIVVAPVVTKVTSAASKVVSKATKAVNKVVPTVHVSVSVPQVPKPSRSSRPAAPAPTSLTTSSPTSSPTSSAASSAGAPAGGSTSGSGRAGGLTATVGGTAADGPAAMVVGAAAPTAGTGAGGGYVVNVPGGSRLAPVSMNQPGTGTGQRATAEHGNAEQASAFGSARFPVLLAILAVLALVAVTIGYVRYNVFGRMI